MVAFTYQAVFNLMVHKLNGQLYKYFHDFGDLTFSFLYTQGKSKSFVFFYFCFCDKCY